ncbi:MAG: low specificity L-threonine aldolase, partial [Haloplanus sp.]
NRDRLAEDHENAERLAAGLDGVDSLSAPTPETNIVVADVSDTPFDPEGFVEACAERGVGCGPFGERTVRFCTHLDVDRDDVDAALDRIAAAVEAA